MVGGSSFPLFRLPSWALSFPPGFVLIFFFTINLDTSLPLQAESLTIKLLVFFFSPQYSNTASGQGKIFALHYSLHERKKKNLNSLSLHIVLVIKLESCHRKILDW